MTANLVWFIVSATLFFPLFTWSIWWVWGSTQAFIGGATLVCVVAIVLLAPQLEVITSYSVASYFVAFLTIIGAAALSTIAFWLAHEHHSMRLPIQPQRNSYGVIDITEPLPKGGE